MKQRLPLVLSATALCVAVLGATPLGHAAEGTVLKKVVPFAKKAAFATKAGLANRAKNASAVNGIKASTTPSAGELLPLGSNGQFPSSVIPSSGPGGNFWSLSGNRIDSAQDFLGTTNTEPLIIKTAGLPAMTIQAGGPVVVDNALRAGTDSDADTGLQGEGVSHGVVGLVKGSASVIPASNLVAGVRGASATGIGVSGSSNSYRGVEGFSQTGIGVLGDSATRGVVGTLEKSSCPGSYAVGGCAGPAAADGVVGSSSEGAGVRAVSTSGGTIFLGESPAGTSKARIDGNGKGFFDGGTQTGGADYAESLRADSAAQLAPGDVLAVDPRHAGTVRKSSVASSQLVVGVYSTRPAVLAVGSHGVNDSLAGEVPVAMLGVVPTRVSAENGAVRPGDLLTTARTAGYAMKARPLVVRGVKIYPTGAILGKALDSVTRGKRMIKVLVNLR